ncbi:MAG: hypothetical protein H8D80_00100 [Proteobacteria bacterium]|nr:hypothetical protein [Pseudomonadota bacterium]
MENNIDFAGSWLEIGMTIAAIIAGAITVLIPIIRKKRWNSLISNKNLDYPENFQWSTHTILHEILTELRVKIDSGRTQIVQFHNTGEFLDGISMKKFSITHESLTSGTSGESGKKDLLVSMFLDKLNLLKKDVPEVHIVETLSDSYTKQYMQSSNIIAFSMLPLRKNKEIIGYLMSQWCSWNKVDAIDNEIVSAEMESSRDRIEIQLQQQLKCKNKGQ